MSKPTIFCAFLTLAFVASACGSSGSDGGSNNVAKGSVAQGEACRSNFDCATVEGRTVKCRCSDTADVPICVTLQKAGESCAITGSFQLECEPNTACVGINDSAPICAQQSSLGQDCGTGTVGGCSEEYTCLNDICSVGVGTLGSDCFEDGDCAADYRCDFMSGCVARIALGQSCSDAGVPTVKTCVDGAGCDMYTDECVALKADGAECGWDSECKSGECSLSGCGAGYRIPNNESYQCGL